MVRAADLRFRGDVAMVAGGCGPRSGELAVFCRPVVTAPAVIRRDGSVLAGGWLPDLARLGELERHLGDGVIEAIVAAVLEAGRLRKRGRRRLMSYPLVIRLMLAMSLMPDASYGEALARVAGLLADVPFALEWHVPTEKVVTDWRVLVPADVMESVFWEAAGPLVSDGEPSAVLRAGMAVCAADGDAGEPRGRAGEPGDVRLHGHRGAGRRGCRAVPAARGADRPRRPGHARRHPRQYAGRGADAAQAAGARPQPARCAAGTTPQSPPTRCPFNATWRHTTRSMTSSQVTASSSLEAIVAGKPQVTVFASGFS